MVGNYRQNGKKQIAVRIFRQTLEIVHLLTGQNPLEVLFEAIVQGGAREDSTRIGSGGTVRRQALMCLHLEESTKLSTLSARDPERLASDLTRAWPKSSPTRS